MEKVIAVNRKARHEYFLEEFYEAGIALTGTEIKSVRKGHVQFKDAYIDFVGNEAFIRDMHIAQYDHGNIFNHDETRLRKLLLHKHEIIKLKRAVQVKGYTVVPTRMYFVKGLAKMEIALARGKDLYDKRQTLKQRDAQREIEKAVKRY
ncbi:MAG: SsrA-binding protein SmpB [Erysipelotrichaceae bacterium]|jgi:SsrA-binding protein|nr:SsrA-binding protein SmpB [Erysipelotrichaceae bacterium]MBQ1304682.1 SsrA-binding protein SmpB [Erysipelotrichaceae bacterium]MBQ1757163.1 SsrA-binding protein SmpB [Erysipelotrichaceae bacterium]MBQ2214585.1 SsrA-binding protein SmpB [Erysipelotrichaceae bacterium]MBQ2685389.1 SsrA-binding protein SmpB [Erysipelotrichaceae bacterium]